MSTNIVILGAGFGGLELSARLSDTLADQVQVTLIDKSDGFVFGFHKFELMLGRATLEELRLNYVDLVKPSVTFHQETITSIDPVARRVVTDAGTYDADILVVALGAEYDFAATPGFVEGGSDFYSIEGAIRLRDLLPTFAGGEVLISVLGEPFKCPPAPCEAAILLDEFFTQRGLGDKVRITLTSPFGRPIPPSADASAVILDRVVERGDHIPQGPARSEHRPRDQNRTTAGRWDASL